MGNANRKKRIQKRKQDIMGGKFQARPRQTTLSPALIDECDIIPCPACGYGEFTRSIQLRRVSRLVTGAPIDSVALVPVDRCGQCGQRVNPQVALGRFLAAEQARLLAKPEAQAQEAGTAGEQPATIITP